MALPKQNLKYKFQTSKQLIAKIPENPSREPVQKDPLIAKGLQREQYVGIFGLAIALIVLVRVLSRKAEHTILFAIFLSTILIIFFIGV